MTTMDKFGHYKGAHGLNQQRTANTFQPDASFLKELKSLKTLVELIFKALNGLRDNFKDNVTNVINESWEQKLKKEVESTIESKNKEVVNDLSELIKNLLSKNKEDLKLLAGTIRKYTNTVTSPNYKRKTEAAEIEIQKKLKSAQTTWVDLFPEFPTKK